jgi:hypothetical protein
MCQYHTEASSSSSDAKSVSMPRQQRCHDSSCAMSAVMPRGHTNSLSTVTTRFGPRTHPDFPPFRAVPSRQHPYP